MAKRLEPANTRDAAAGGPLPTMICEICGGGVVPEDGGRAERYPRRRICRVCGAEYGTTMTTARNY